MLVDTHVHIYDCFDLDIFFNAALANFLTAEEKDDGAGRKGPYILLLAEAEHCDWFGKVKSAGKVASDHWQLEHCGDQTLQVSQKDGDGVLYVAAGRQIVTAERLEVLSLCSAAKVDSHLSLADTIEAVWQGQGVPVIPWGVGKWLGQRGRLLDSYLLQDKAGRVFLGDNGGRPKFWGRPRQFDSVTLKRLPVLPGSDPLPLASDARRAGSCGIRLEQQLPLSTDPVSFLREVLLTGAIESCRPYGRQLGTLRFFTSQLSLRLPSGN